MFIEQGKVKEHRLRRSRTLYAHGRYMTLLFKTLPTIKILSHSKTEAKGIPCAAPNP